jgi:hypothetical protein
VFALLGIPFELQAQKRVGLQYVSYCCSYKTKLLIVAMYITNIQEDPSSHFRIITENKVENMQS